MTPPLRITILGLSISSSWGNGHATIFRALVKALVRRGHRVTFLERDVPWYARQRDLDELRDRHHAAVADADLAIVGSYVPDGIAVGRWVTQAARGVTAFYDISTPVTLARLERDDCDYIDRQLIPRYDLYLSFAGGPTLDRLERAFGSPRALPFYCCVDPQHYFPSTGDSAYDLGYMGTYSDDCQPPLERLLLEPARRWGDGRFVVAGPQYPADIAWPANVQRIEHLPPAEHRAFYNRQRWTLNITRADMIRADYAPSVRLFEAAACATPIISDRWQGLDELRG